MKRRESVALNRFRLGRAACCRAATLSAALCLAIQPASAQTAQPSVEVNLEVLDSLGPAPSVPVLDLYGKTPSIASPNLYGSASQIPGAVSEESVLLLPAPVGSDDSTGSVLLPDAPATTASNDFEMPEPATAMQPEDELKPVAITTTQPAPEPEPIPEPMLEPTMESEIAATESEVAAASMADTMSSDSDAFDKIEALLAEPVGPKTIEVPEPEMTMDDADEIVSASINPDATTGGMTILFEADSDALTDADENMLRGLAGQLDANQDQRVQLRAYASSENSSTSDARRLALSRALAVRAFLIESNVRSTRIDVRALGDKAEGGPLDRIDIILVDR